MKKLFPSLTLLLTIVAFSPQMSGQFIHLGVGYNANLVGMKGLNAAVDEYNEPRTYLSKEMNKFHSLGGMTIHASAGAANILLGVDYSWRRNTNTSKGTFSGTDFVRYLKMKQDVFGFSLGGVAAESGAAFAGGLRMELYNPKVFTRIQEGDEPKPDWDLVNSPVIHANVGPFVKLHFGPKEMWPAGFFVSAYYGYALFKTEMHEVDEYLNGRDYSWDGPPEKFVTRNNVFSIAFGYGVAFTGN